LGDEDGLRKDAQRFAREDLGEFGGVVGHGGFGPEGMAEERELVKVGGLGWADVGGRHNPIVRGKGTSADLKG
jgi:hypothetical protein